MRHSTSRLVIGGVVGMAAMALLAQPAGATVVRAVPDACSYWVGSNSGLALESGCVGVLLQDNRVTNVTSTLRAVVGQVKLCNFGVTFTYGARKTAVTLPVNATGCTAIVAASLAVTWEPPAGVTATSPVCAKVVSLTSGAQLGPGECVTWS